MISASKSPATDHVLTYLGIGRYYMVSVFFFKCCQLCYLYLYIYIKYVWGNLYIGIYVPIYSGNWNQPSILMIFAPFER